MAYTIGIYLRLSDDDNDISEVKSESNSISGQRSIIKEFISSNPELCTCRTEEFCDDGYTGVNFNRPAVTKLFEAVKSGTVQCIIVKDLSRFGRNVVEVGNYVEQIFPLLGIRFIAINDSFDSRSVSGAIDAGFALHSIMNENYSLDISEKVKAVKKIHKQKGYHLGSIAPYGYFIENKQLYVDKQAAEIVKRIFIMADNGLTYKGIARTLNDEGIPTRTEYLNCKNKTHLWTPKNISKIVHNPVYMGTLINNRQETIAPRITRTNDKSQWLVFENHHEPIISQKLFQSVSKRFYYKSSPSTNTEYNPEFKGKVYCGSCGKPLTRHYFINKGDLKRSFSYMCDYAIDKNCCTDRVLIDELKAVVVKSLEVQIQLAVDNCNMLMNNIKNEQQAVNGKIEKLSTEIDNLEKRKIVLYSDFKNGIYTRAEFISKREQLIDRIYLLKEEKDNALNQPLPTSAFTQAANFLDSYRNNELTQELLIQKYLKAVYIYSGKRIEIVWGFADIFK